jgi:hypothetical protein
MIARINDREIPKEERKRLAQEVSGKSIFRMIEFVAILAALICAHYVAAETVSERYSLHHFFVGLVVAICVAVVIRLMLIGPLVRREVEKAKNA